MKQGSTCRAEWSASALSPCRRSASWPTSTSATLSNPKTPTTTTTPSCSWRSSTPISSAGTESRRATTTPASSPRTTAPRTFGAAVYTLTTPPVPGTCSPSALATLKRTGSSSTVFRTGPKWTTSPTVSDCSCCSQEESSQSSQPTEFTGTADAAPATPFAARSSCSSTRKPFTLLFPASSLLLERNLTSSSTHTSSTAHNVRIASRPRPTISPSESVPLLRSS